MPNVIFFFFLLIKLNNKLPEFYLTWGSHLKKSESNSANTGHAKALSGTDVHDLYSLFLADKAYLLEHKDACETLI